MAPWPPGSGEITPFDGKRTLAVSHIGQARWPEKRRADGAVPDTNLPTPPAKH
jgi:hypothetical protein